MYTCFTVPWVHTMRHKYNVINLFSVCRVATFSIVLLYAVYNYECAASVWTYFQQSGGKYLTCPQYKCPFVK